MSLTTSALSVESWNDETSGQPVVRFPRVERQLEQDSEWCEVYSDGEWQRLRLHDYADIYRQPGLYEQLFAKLLQCRSPQRVVGLLENVLADDRQNITQLNVLDIGAGNGLVGEEYRRRGVRGLIGLDIVPEAAAAAKRDRPGLYDDYLVADLTKLTAIQVERLKSAEINALSTVSALGFGDIPVRAFAAAYAFVAVGGWLAFNIKENFLSGQDSTGFSRLIRALSDTGAIQLEAYRRYTHRLSVAGKPLKYVAMVARKKTEVSAALVDRTAAAAGEDA